MAWNVWRTIVPSTRQSVADLVEAHA